MCFTFDIYEGKEAEYKKRHDEIWPDLVADIKAAGFKNYTLFRRGLTVVGYFEVDGKVEDVFAKILRNITETVKTKAVTQSILDYVEFKGEASYTEMQNFYRITFGSNSFSHILISLVVPYKNRTTRRYLYKTASGKYVVRVAGLHNWVEKDY